MQIIRGQTNGCAVAIDPSCRRVQVEQAAVAHEPDFPAAVCDDLRDPSHEPTIAVVQEVSKGPGRRIESVETAFRGPEPQTAASVAGHALNLITADAIRIAGVVTVDGEALGLGIEPVYAAEVGGNPQITSIVLEQIPDPVGAQTVRVVRVVLVSDEAVAIVPIEAISRGKPHEAPAVLQDCLDTDLRETVVRGEVCKSEIPSQAGRRRRVGRERPSGFPNVDVEREAFGGLGI